MHFEFLVEDASGAILLGAVLERILGPDGTPHTRRIHAYKGIGRVPAGLVPGSDADRRILLEEMEAWLLGDPSAIRRSYPRADVRVLDRYVQDGVCGTWEVLADAIHRGGSRALKKQGWPHIGNAKCEWARQLGPELDVEGNRSKSFQVFRDGVRRLASSSTGDGRP